MTLLKAIAIWCVILLFAVLNGGLREALLLPAFGAPLAQILSGLLLALIILALSFVLVPRIGPLRRAQAMRIGLLWLGLTLGFEFGFGLWVQGHSWSELLAAYTFKDGNLWTLVLVVIFLAPSLAVRFGRRWP